MNKYALTLPLVILSVLLGYIGLNLKMEHVYVFLVFTAAGVTIAGYLFWKILRQRPKQNSTANK
jgi:hypothetical protein